MFEEKIDKASETYGHAHIKNVLKLDREPTFHEMRLQKFDTYGLKTAFELGAMWALQHQWVSVENALPTNNDDVLVSYTDIILSCENVGIANYDATDGEWYSNDDDVLLSRRSIRFWMPIPPLSEARKEDEK